MVGWVEALRTPSENPQGNPTKPRPCWFSLRQASYVPQPNLLILSFLSLTEQYCHTPYRPHIADKMGFGSMSRLLKILRISKMRQNLQ